MSYVFYFNFLKSEKWIWVQKVRILLRKCILSSDPLPPRKGKHRITVQSSNFNPRYIPKRHENTHPNFGMNVRNSIIRNRQKVQTTQRLSTGEWRNTTWPSHTMEYYWAIQRIEY